MAALVPTSRKRGASSVAKTKAKSRLLYLISASIDYVRSTCRDDLPLELKMKAWYGLEKSAAAA